MPHSGVRQREWLLHPLLLRKLHQSPGALLCTRGSNTRPCEQKEEQAGTQQHSKGPVLSDPHAPASIQHLILFLANFALDCASLGPGAHRAWNASLRSWRISLLESIAAPTGRNDGPREVAHVRRQQAFSQTPGGKKPSGSPSSSSPAPFRSARRRRILRRTACPVSVAVHRG